MKKLIYFTSLLLLLWSCDNDHFITDKDYRKKVRAQFEIAKDLAKNRNEQLFGVFDQHLSLKEKEALQFLYAYMPLSDLADYDGDFYLRNVRASFAARDTFSWGKKVPEDLFRHFVLPVRVNNENLDSSRIVFFEELKGRIRGMSMTDAALEVNHWCHEKVTYKGSDARTSSPLATVKNAYGRCGEESTFTVAAMRAACIPARQCYTPRWAHVDDNHAWVEVWVDGKWHFLGACEPEPALDMGWFSGPSKRAMLVSTNVFGDYTGPEDVLLKDPRFTRINVLPNYTDTKRIFVKVTDEAGNVADSAAVEFQLYNYAEFYPLTRSYTDEKGLCSFLTGYGDLVIWAAKDKKFGFMKISAGQADTVNITLNKTGDEEYSLSFDLVPPPPKDAQVIIGDSLKNENSRRLEFEDQIRGNYEKTFIDSAKTWRLAATISVNPDTLWEILRTSRGNYRNIIDFVTSVPDSKKDLVFPLLQAVSEKDLHDITQEVLFDQINAAGRFATVSSGREMYFKYVLNPRIDNENLKPYQTLLQTSFEDDFINSARKDPQQIREWIISNIKTDSKANYGRASLTPAGTFGLKVADPLSRDIFFVGLCRSLGIPSRLEPATRMPQYFLDGKWHDVIFDPDKKSSERGILMLKKDPAEKEINPEYYIHYTVEKLNDGFFRSLDYENDPSVRNFPARLEIVPGSYMIVTGNRLQNGTVLAKVSFVKIFPAKETDFILQFRKKATTDEVIRTDAAGFLKNVTGRDEKPGAGGNIIAWLEPEKEPSRHFIADIIAAKKDLSAWNGSIIFLFRSEKDIKLFLDKNSAEIPAGIKTLVAPANSVSYAATVTGKDLSVLPAVIYISKNGDLEYTVSGYRIGTGDDLLRLIKK